MYQGMPIMSKQIKLISLNPTVTQDLYLTNVITEILGVNIPFSPGAVTDAMSCAESYTQNQENMAGYNGLLWIQNDAGKITRFLFVFSLILYKQSKLTFGCI